MAISVQARNNLIALTIGMFDAAPGALYLNQLVTAFEAGMSYNAIANVLDDSEAFKSVYPPLQTSTEFATSLIDNLLGTEVSAASRTWAIEWVAGQINGGASKGAVIVAALTALLNNTNPDYNNAKFALFNKIAVAEYYSVTKNLSDTDLVDLQGVIANVTSAASSVTAARAQIDMIVPGDTFTLTTDADNLIGSGANDSFTGLAQATGFTTGDTLTAADVINGGAGIDTLNITTTANNTNVTAGALINNVEIVNIRATNGTAELNASTIGGLTAVNANAGAGAVTVTNLASGAAIGVIGNGTVLNGTTTYGYATATGAQIINISGSTTGGDITSSNGTATSVTINSTGVSNKVGTIDPSTGTTVTSLTINAATGLEATLNAAYANTATLTITGAGDVKLNGTSTAAFKTITSTSTGAVNVGDVGTVATAYTGGSGVDTLTLNTAIKTVNTGAGNDVVTTGAVDTTDAGAVNGGEGNDTLVVANAAHVDTAGERAVYTGFETLNNGTGAAIAVEGFTGITALVSSANGGGFTGLSAAQAAAITNTTNQTAVTYALATATGTSDVLSITARATPSTGSADLKGLTITGFETLNVTSASGNVDEMNANANEISFAAAADLSTITVGGAFGAWLNLDNTAKAVTVTSTQTGTAALRIEGEVVKGSSITATANGDTIETALAGVAGAAGEFVTYNAGAGDDSITTSLTALNNTNNGLASLKIEGGAGVDTLTLQAADTTLVDANVQYVTGVEKLVVASTTGLNLTSGGFFDNNFKASGIDLTAAGITNGNTATINLGSFTGASKIALTSTADGASAADNINVTTGSGADDVTVTASSWVGAVGAAGSLAVTTGAGNDKISVTTGTLLAVTGTNAVTINAGLGADTITTVHVNAGAASLGNITYVIADGDSLAASRDKITGFDLGTAGLIADTLDLEGTPTVTADGAANGTDAGSLKSHSITSGIVTFDDVDTFATAVVINQANLADALAYLAANITTAGDTVAFAFDSDSSGTADATIVFQQGAADTVVELVGVVGLSLSGTNATTAGLIDLA